MSEQHGVQSGAGVWDPRLSPKCDSWTHPVDLVQVSVSDGEVVPPPVVIDVVQLKTGRVQFEAHSEWGAGYGAEGVGRSERRGAGLR